VIKAGTTRGTVKARTYASALTILRTNDTPLD